MLSTPPICITGMGCICAVGANCQDILENMSKPNPPALSKATQLHKEAMPYAFFASPTLKEGRFFSARDTLNLATLAAKQALDEAKLSTKAKEQCAVVLGTTAGSALHFLDGYAKARKLMPKPSGQEKLEQEIKEQATENSNDKQQDIQDYFSSNLALSLAVQNNMLGPSLTIANACTSGADALGIGMDMLLQNQCEAVLCGGADALSLVPHTGFARLMIYSQTPCRPFDAQRKGLNLGEGAGLVVLEKTEHAKARKANILGYVAGYGAFADAHHFTAPHPNARGLSASVEAALKQAKISKDSLAFINAHGTATQENDKVEGKYFKDNLDNIPVWGSKSMTGHTLGAAGAIEAIFCLLALNTKNLPKTHGFENIDPEIAISPTTSSLAIQKQYALSTSLGFGGSNAALILRGAL